jgi:ankyrin repeat protein
MKEIKNVFKLTEKFKDNIKLYTWLSKNHYGFNLNKPNFYNYLPLQEAVRTRNMDITRILLEKGFSANTRMPYGNNPLLHSVAHSYDTPSDERDNNLEILKLLIKFGADVNAKGHFGEAALHMAAETGNLKGAEILLENGANVDIKDDGKYTPLFSAVHNNRLKMVDYLISKGANANSESKLKTNCLFNVFYNRNYTYRYEPERLEIVKLLIENRINVDQRDENGSTPLHKSFIYNDYHVAKLLIENGANPIIAQPEGTILVDISSGKIEVDIKTKMDDFERWQKHFMPSTSLTFPTATQASDKGKELNYEKQEL